HAAEHDRTEGPVAARTENQEVEVSRRFGDLPGWAAVEQGAGHLHVTLAHAFLGLGQLLPELLTELLVDRYERDVLRRRQRLVHAQQTQLRANRASHPGGPVERGS